MKREDLKHLNPIRFTRESLSYMQGTPRIRFWLYLPIAYIRYCYYMLKG